MCPRVYVLLVALLAAMAAGVHAADRPKLPRGARCRACFENRIRNNGDEKLSFMAVDREEELAEVPMFPEALIQRRSPYWPLKHPALALDARKRHRESPTFLHPVARFVLPSYNELGGPYVGGDDGWDDPKPLTENYIRDRPAEKQRPMTAEDLIRALQEQYRQLDDDALKVNTVRFGGIGRK